MYFTTLAITVPKIALLTMILLGSFVSAARINGVHRPGSLPPHPRVYAPRQVASGGWPNIEKLFVFGDSWSTINFDLAGVQPSPDQPLGNPPYPGNTPTYGSNWPTYLTTQYNVSFLETYDFAQSGATLNATIINHGADVVSQIEKEFIPYYGAMNASSWQSENALFAVFIGINDVNVALTMLNMSTEAWLEMEFVSYANLVDELYQTGARNFLFINMPPMDRAPGDNAARGPVITDWNTHLINMGNNLTTTHDDTKVWQFDMNSFLNTVIDTPTTYPQTAGLVNTTQYCTDYGSMDKALDYFVAECGLPLKEYLWVNNLHITAPAHDAMAAQIAVTLGA